MAGRVMVTGLGIVSPLGKGAAANWENLVGAGHVPSRHEKPASVKGPLVSFRAGTWPAPTGYECARELSRWAAAQALADAGLWDGRSLQNIDPERIGCTLSASKPLASSFPAASSALTPFGCRGMPVSRSGGESMGPRPATAGDDVFWVPPDLINDFVSRRFGLHGERRNVIAACATGVYSIALGASWIEQGLCDIVLAGSVEPYPHPLIEAGFRQMGVTSGDATTRPFDLHRSGFAFGEGSGAVVLESSAHAAARRAAPAACLSGWALGADTHSPVAFNSNGAGIAGVIERALARGGLSKKAVGHVNAHGTGTRLNDRIETQALQKAFGRHADRLMISATKGSTGHLLGASGAVEFIFTLLALAHQVVPPTATLEHPDPECPLDYTPRIAHAAIFDHALSLSFGFGGPIGALVISRP